jgi:hypothetical protein
LDAFDVIEVERLVNLDELSSVRVLYVVRLAVK